MAKKKDTKVILGIVVITIIAIGLLVGISKMDFDTVPVPQVESGNVTYTDLTVPTPVSTIKEIKNNNINTMQEKQEQNVQNLNGVKAEILRGGNGDRVVKLGDTITVDYKGMFIDGTVFDQSYSRGEKFTFPVGGGLVIRGWEEGVIGMKIGEKRKLTIPSELAYGPNDYGPIPGGSTLVFEIELHSIQ